MDHEGTGCQAPDRSILCIKNCGFFGSAATRNMCSKCHKETVIQEVQAKIAASSFESVVNGSSSKAKEPIIVTDLEAQPKTPDQKPFDPIVTYDSSNGQISDIKNTSPSRCTTCRKRVGLTGFECKCGNIFCATHRYSDKHDCPFDYRAANQNAIAKANPVIKTEKLRKI